MIVLMFYTTLSYHMYGLLGIFNAKDDEQCSKYWWSNLLYINNFVPGGMAKMVIPHSDWLCCIGFVLSKLISVKYKLKMVASSNVFIEFLLEHSCHVAMY